MAFLWWSSHALGTISQLVVDARRRALMLQTPLTTISSAALFAIICALHVPLIRALLGTVAGAQKDGDGR